ncbi:sigma-70 family RNA polymerase sigma factor [Nocardioides mangrovicus]|uniref:RNA polymerase sigma factor n=1 Tax=Nocardioides mangrovicus TaxID=2478913 RepID=A0A3L8NX60_9ACTN|nr:ECF RNA polymerase sigma factor SigK [Nocardioides mangrovicus]RLV47524.1 sigma-70 family RNA polymerase sigma factor [Nocardioides mangrovicus]
MSGIRAVPDGGDHADRAARARQDQSAQLAALIQRSGRGDERAFAALYDAVVRRLHGLVLRVVRDPAQAEEVTQEAMVEVWRQSARYDPALGSPLSWLMTIAHRRAVDRVRSAEASSRRDTTYHQQNQSIDHDATAEAVAQNLEGHRVRQALASLTDTQRGALELAYFGGYTHTEVANLLDIPLGTAKTRIRDGLIRLRDTLGADHE